MLQYLTQCGDCIGNTDHYSLHSRSAWQIGANPEVRLGNISGNRMKIRIRQNRTDDCDGGAMAGRCRGDTGARFTGRGLQPGWEPGSTAATQARQLLSMVTIGQPGPACSRAAVTPHSAGKLGSARLTRQAQKDLSASILYSVTD